MAPRARVWVFRGHADASWALLPTALRLCLAGKLSDFDAGATPLSKVPNTDDLLHLGWVLLQRFMITADMAGVGVPEPHRPLVLGLPLSLSGRCREQLGGEEGRVVRPDRLLERNE